MTGRPAIRQLPRTVLAVAAVAVLLVVLGAGCAPSSQEPHMDANAKLAARPTAQAMVARYEEMQRLIREQLDAALGPHPWKVMGKGDEAGCGFGEFLHTDGEVVFLDPWGFEGSISDADWPRAKEIITRVTAKYGFTVPTLQINQPGHHETDGFDPVLGARYAFGTQIDTSMSVTTGCHRQG